MLGEMGGRLMAEHVDADGTCPDAMGQASDDSARNDALPPDSPEDVASTVRTWLDVDPDARSVTVMKYALEDLAGRIERLGGRK